MVVVEPGWFGRTFWLLRRSFIVAADDNLYGIAKGAAYSGLLSLFPVLTSFVAIMVQIRADAVVHIISRLTAGRCTAGHRRIDPVALRG